MAPSAFPYPGGKSVYHREIIRYFPDHRRYVEPFGGSAAVLMNEPPSYMGIYNDLDDDVVHFFRLLRDRREELEEWVSYVPYSRSLYDTWVTAFDEDDRPEGDVERAGRMMSFATVFCDPPSKCFPMVRSIDMSNVSLCLKDIFHHLNRV